jgi:DNA-binding LacI/PurR family transcriptional regulator
MESKGKTLKERLPHKAISEIAAAAGVSFLVVSRVVNRTVHFKRSDGRRVRICSEEMEQRILALAEQYAKRYEELIDSLRSAG